MNRDSVNGGSYTSLDRVYQGTTLPKHKHTGKMKRMIRFGGRAKKNLEPLLTQSLSFVTEAFAEGPLDKEKQNDLRKMPTKNAEEAALLGVVPIDNMDDIELKNIQLQFPSARQFGGEGACAEVRVRTDRGDLLVAVLGDRSKPAILTYHDLGLNYVCFHPFFNFVDMRALLENFCVYHVNAPGQEEGAPSLPDEFIVPKAIILVQKAENGTTARPFLDKNIETLIYSLSWSGILVIVVGIKSLTK